MTEFPYVLAMVRVTSAELQRYFGRFRDRALREPVSVTHHGRDSLVLLSADEFARLKSLDSRQALYAWELSQDALADLAASVPAAECTAFDDEADA
jgi:PHD/YefM family antitoxin component YafN of YafNO toxin-antitoxin module